VPLLFCGMERPGAAAPSVPWCAVVGVAHEQAGHQAVNDVGLAPGRRKRGGVRVHVQEPQQAEDADVGGGRGAGLGGVD